MTSSSSGYPERIKVATFFNDTSVGYTNGPLAFCSEAFFAYLKTLKSVARDYAVMINY